MLRALVQRAVPGLLAVGACLAQPPAFDVASVKLVDPAGPFVYSTGGPGTKDPGRIRLGRATMQSLLVTAYGVQWDQVAGGPGWVSDYRNLYQIEATMPPDTTKAQYQAMLQGLLAERFHLAVHHETRNFPGYELVVAKGGPKMQESIQRPKTEGDSVPAFPKVDKDGHFIGPMTVISSGAYRQTAEGESMAELAADLGSAMLSMALGADMTSNSPRPRVIDKTGLTGKYNFKLEFDCPGCRGRSAMSLAPPSLGGAETQAASPGSGLPGIFAAIERLGLRLEKVKDVPLDVIVIDRVDRMPTAN
ncbi:MAG: TIGR03435 family protein [Bryobacteraceae bacterium]